MNFNGAMKKLLQLLGLQTTQLGSKASLDATILSVHMQRDIGLFNDPTTFGLRQERPTILQGYFLHF